jgi:glycoside/pentoside/hexuronide:cation symporter, GPH family
MAEQSEKVSFRTKFFYGSGSIAFGIKDNGFGAFLGLYYNQVLGLEFRLVGYALLIMMIVDAISDPIVGHLSDNLHSKWGRRHPFMYFAAAPLAICYFLLWNPIVDQSQQSLFLYLVFMTIAVRTFITMFEIPSTSLGPELAKNYDERTSLLSTRVFFGWWAGLTMAVLAYTVFLRPTADNAYGQLNPDGYQTYGLVGAIGIFAAIIISSLGTHRHIPNLSKPEVRSFNAKQAALELKESFSNHNFVVLFIGLILLSIGGGLAGAMQIYFGTFFWELPATSLGILVLSGFPAATISLIAAPIIARKFGKKEAVIGIATAAILVSPAMIAGRLLGILPENGDPLLFPLLWVHMLVELTLVTAASMITNSMVADVVEESELATGRRSEGAFYSARSFAAKAVSGVGKMGSMLLLAAIAFPMHAKPGEIPQEVLYKLGLIYIPCGLIFYLSAVASITFYRIDRKTHEANLAQLAAVAAEKGDR